MWRLVSNTQLWNFFDFWVEKRVDDSETLNPKVSKNCDERMNKNNNRKFFSKTQCFSLSVQILIRIIERKEKE